MSYLKRVGAALYFRRRIPLEFQDILRTREVQTSLGTSCYERAKALASRLNQQFEDAMFSLRMGAKPETVFCLIPGNKGKKTAGEQAQRGACSVQFECFSREMVTTGKWNIKTEFENRSCFSLFLRVAGDLDIKTVTHAQLLDYREKITRLPPNLNKNPGTANRDIEAILCESHAKTLSRVRVNRNMTVLSSFFKWLFRHEIIEKNPALNLLVPKEKIRADEERQKYSEQEIMKIAGLVAGFKKEKPERYWVPLIAIFSGMRLNEICQLYIEDIREEDGIWCFDINENKDKKLKNTASRRIIPVHPVLLENGILNFANDLYKSAQLRLFPALRNHRKNGYAHQLGQWFQRFNREAITADPRKTFHSIRHTVADTLKQNGIAEAIIAEILGHSCSSITMGRYGKRFRPALLLEALKEISMPPKYLLAPT